MTPTRLSAAVFASKVAVLRARRALRDVAGPVPLHRKASAPAQWGVVARSQTLLWTDHSPAEQWHQRGKVQNLGVAAAAIDGCLVPAGQVFSFWRQVGRASLARGFSRGRMLQEGCVIPSVGGGLCQLSNALYQVALAAGCEIVERHARSRTVPGSATAAGQDATVAWNYIDLRFRPRADAWLRVQLTDDHLVVELRSAGPAPSARPMPSAPAAAAAAAAGPEHACHTCGKTSCFRKSDLPKA